MIKIKITKDRIEMSGHADRKGSDGIDRACAGVSALTCNLINSLRELTCDEIHTTIGSGMTVIIWEKLSDGGRLLMDSWFLGLTDINQEYNCIKFSN